jgi:tetratricopeptide (TPR) repeat protein
LLASTFWGTQGRTLAQEADRALAATSAETHPLADPYQAIEDLRKQVLQAAQQLLRDFPRSEEPLTLLGIIHHGQGKNNLAMNCWRQSLAVNPRQVDTLHNMALVAMERADYTQAVAYWQQALQIDPAKAGLHLGIGRAWLELGEPQRAIEAFEAELDISPQSIGGQYYLSQAYLQLEDYRSAKRCLLQVLAADPQHSDILYGLFMVSQRLGETEEARAYAQRFQQHKQQSLDARDIDSAAHLAQVKNSAAALFQGMAKVYHDHGHLPKAALLYQQAVNNDPKNLPVLRLLFSIYQRIDRRDAALQIAEQMALLEPQNPKLFRATGTLALQINRFASAERAYQRLIELTPRSPIGYRGLAEVDIKAKQQPARALQNAEKAVALEPVAESYYLLCWAWLRNGDKQKALAAIDQAVLLAPMESRYFRLLEQIRSLP